MANAPGFLSKDHIEKVKQLKGRAHVTYPYAETAHRRTERYENPIRSATWEKTFGAADTEYTEAKLVEQVKLYEDDQYAYCYFRYEELTGLPLKTWELYKGEAYKVTERQRVPAGTKPDRAGATTLSHTITETNALYADSVKVYLADLTGVPLETGAIIVTERIDAQTGALIYTDLYLAAADTTLPTTFVGGDPLTVIALIGDWKKPNAAAGSIGIGYGGVSYSPIHLPIDARKINIEGSAMVWIEVDHCRKPTSHVWDEAGRKRWPKPFAVNPEFFLSNNYGGRFQPPWPIGAENTDGYTPDSHAYGGYQRTIEHYTRGRFEGLPPIFQVTSPGIASMVFGSHIDEETIHGPWKLYETVTSGASSAAFLIEDIPSSTPSSYDPSGIYVLDAKCEPWRGEWWKTTLIQGSEQLTPRDFPDPKVDGYYDALRTFTITPAVVLNARLGGKKLYAQTVAAGGGVGSETVRIKLWGKQSAEAGPLSTSEIVTARPTVSSASTLSQNFINIRCATLEQPTASDSVIIREQVTPSSAPLKITGTPTDGDVLEIGLASGPLYYQQRTALTSDAVTSITVASAGTGYLVAPIATIDVPDTGSDQATAIAHISSGAITGFTITHAGRGYVPGDLPAITLSDGGTGASATSTLTSNRVTSFAVGAAGTRYSTAPGVTVTAAGTAATASGTLTGDAVSAINIVSAGSGYTSAPLVTITGGGGSGATAHATISGGAVSGYVVDAGGSGYVSAVTVTLTYGRGQGAKGTASVAGGAVTGIVPKTATFTANASTNIITATAHGLVDGDGLTFASGTTLPGGISAGTVYYIQRTTADTFKIATSITNLAASVTVDITNAGTGVHTMTYGGQGYLTAPTVSFSGGAGSGGAGTAVVSQARQIKISSTPATMAARIYQAVRGEGLGINVGLGTIAHPDLTAAREKSDLSTVHFFSRDPIIIHDAGEWALALHASGSAWGVATAFTAGELGEILCTIPAGQSGAFFAGIMSFAANTCLTDAATDNDAKAQPSLPGLVTLYGDWMPIPPGKSLTLIYAATGPGLKVAYQLNSGATEPAALTTTGVTVTATNGSRTISAVDAAHIGKAILIEGDTQENEILSTTGLMRPYGGAAGSHAATITNCVAHLLPTAGFATLREVVIGDPGASFLRVKIQQPIVSISDRLSLLRCPAMYAGVQWKVTPDDDSA